MEIMLVRNLASPTLNSTNMNPDTDNEKQQIVAFIGPSKSQRRTIM